MRRPFTPLSLLTGSGRSSLAFLFQLIFINLKSSYMKLINLFKHEFNIKIYNKGIRIEVKACFVTQRKKTVAVLRFSFAPLLLLYPVNQ